MRNDSDTKSLTGEPSTNIVLSNLELYQKKYKRPINAVVICTFISNIILLVLTLFYSRLTEFEAGYVPSSTNILNDQLKVALVFLSIYIGCWVAYFVSGYDSFLEKEGAFSEFAKEFKVQSLRRLLKISSVQWYEQLRPYLEGKDEKQKLTLTKEQFKERFEKKAQSSITAVAILVAASVLVLELVLGLVIEIEKGEITSLSQKVFIFGAFLSSSFCFLNFVTAVDDLDTIFNDFTDGKEQCVLDHFFYKRSATPRFVALALLVLSVCLIFMAQSIFYGCLGISIAIYVMYPHMFPCFDDDYKPKKDAKWPRVGIIAVAILMRLIGVL